MVDVWTRIAKPIESSVVSSGGDAIPWGLLLAITSVTGGQAASVVSGWTDISKPTSSIWTSISKPTNSVWSLIAKPTS